MLDCYKNATMPELEKELACMKKKLAKFNFMPELNGHAKRSTAIATRNHGMYMLAERIRHMEGYINDTKRTMQTSGAKELS